MKSVVALILCYLAQVSIGKEQPVVETKLGRYGGYYMKSFAGREFSTFSGIRYAEIPKRYEEPKKVNAHEGLYDATKEGEDCVQHVHNYNKYPLHYTIGKKFVGSEDCLFLNIYSPNVNPKKPYPVMVWIHGGGFMIGSGSKELHGPEFILDKDVVLVSLNYRLSSFGFLSYDDDVIPGNNGLKDQSLALQWVKDNIASFGGDPNSITIFGESAGSASVHMQMHSPRNKGVFQRAISQSGTMDNPWAFISKSIAKERALGLASYLECPSTNAQDFLECLQKQPLEKVIDAEISLKKMKTAMELIFKPVLESKDGGFFTEKDILKRSSMPWMSGVNSGEGLIIYSEMIAASGDRNFSDFNAHQNEIISNLLNYEQHPQAEKITKLIKQNYLGDGNADFSQSNIIGFVNMFSDKMFIHGHLVSSIKHEGENYFYLLTHEGEKSFSVFSQINNIGAGVHHADELMYLFPLTKLFPKINFNKEDSKVQKLFIELWTNFAIYGNPTPKKSKTHWDESEKGKVYATITADGIKLAKNLYSSRMVFWDNLDELLQYKNTKEEL